MSRSSKKLERELYGPGLVEVTVGAVLSIAIGALLAATYLVVQPVEVVKSLPKEPEAGKVYYVSGSTNSGAGRQWLRKKQMLVEGGAGEITLSDSELNTWMSSSRAKPDADAGTAMFAVTEINFRVHGDSLQIGVPCSVNIAGISRAIVVQTQGGFERRDDHFAYVANEVLIGTLPAHRLPFVGSFVVGRLLAAQTVPEDLSTAWRQLSDVTVADNQLKLSRL